jgi:hypothetical protein
MTVQDLERHAMLSTPRLEFATKPDFLSGVAVQRKTPSFPKSLSATVDKGTGSEPKASTDAIPGMHPHHPKSW